ncbi:MAG: haloalkane dehalogenase [Candidatus Nanopelagicales bacterium]
MDVLRTPDERFADLPDYPWAPRYVEVDDDEGGALRVHVLDVGDPAAAPVLLLHGEPSWSYLYRSMVPVLVDAGLRVVAPDLVGFGRSDKPARPEDHTYARHVGWVTAAVLGDQGGGLDLHGVTLVGQDWGGLIGLRVLAENPDRFTAAVVANTGLPTGDRPLTDAFAAWQRFARETPEFPVGGIVSGGCRTPLAPEVVAAYDAPFPDESYKAGPRALPALVPTSPDDPAADANRRAWEVLAAWDRPLLTAFSDSDPITAGGERVFQRTVPGAAGVRHVTIRDAGHFLQEDRGPVLADTVVRFLSGDLVATGTPEDLA